MFNLLTKEFQMTRRIEALKKESGFGVPIMMSAAKSDVEKVREEIKRQACDLARRWANYDYEIQSTCNAIKKMTLDEE
jgi:Fe2+ transport system protein B